MCTMWSTSVAHEGIKQYTTCLPAISALETVKSWKCPQAASRMLLFSPPLAAAPLGRKCPGCSGFGCGSGAMPHLLDRQVFHDEGAVAVDSLPRELMLKVLALVSDLAIRFG